MNPFRDTIVATAWDGSASDVEEVHSRVFSICLEGLETVRKSERSAALLLHGIPGSGKTHLLRRLRMSLLSDRPVSTDRPESLFVWVRLQTSPRAIWRHVRRRLVEDWFRSSPGVRSQFDHVLYQRLAEVRPAEGDLERWVEYMRQESPADLEVALDEIADLDDLDRNTTVAFKHLAFDRFRRDLRAWLSGDSLPEAALQRLELVAEDGSEEDREQLARQTVLMLCRLAGRNLPVALCFDQVEALQISAEDREGLYAFGQLVSTLHDETRNLMLISCVQSAYAEDLKTRSRGADFDRIRSYGSYVLDPLTRSQAESVISARLATAVGVDASKRPSPWPLTESELSELLKFGDLTPRRLLTACAERFELRSSTPPGDEPVQQPGPVHEPGPVSPPSPVTLETHLQTDWDRRWDDASGANSPELTDSIIRDAVPMLLRIVSPDFVSAADDRLPDVQLIFAGERGRFGISLCTEPNMTSLAKRLKRLLDQHRQGRLTGLTIIRDSRHPVSPTAKKTLERLSELQSAGATILTPSIETLVALDVLRGILSDAKAGDLSCQGETIPQLTVERWLRQHLPTELSELQESVTGERSSSGGPGGPNNGPEAAILLEELASALLENPVQTIDDLAITLGRPSEEVAQTVLRYPDRIRLLQGPPLVVFRVP